MPPCPCPFLEKIACERKICALVSVYSMDVCESRIDESTASYPKHRECLCGCIRFHAEQTAERSQSQKLIADELIESLRCGAVSGGDPLRDCVLAKSMLLNDHRAPMIFERDYFDYLANVARQVHLHFGNAPDEWWNDFLDFLAGYTHTKGKLEKYCGKSALRFWLRIVLWNFLKRKPMMAGGTEVSEEIVEKRTDNNSAELNEEVELFAAMVRKILETLSARDRLLLSLVYIDNLLKKDIAAIFQVHPGQIGRWQDSVLERFRTALTEELKIRSHREEGDSVSEEVTRHPKEFADILVETLKTLRKNDRVLA